ncbi:uncharacterized protein LOC123548655 isoform X2 [Mercenaria mercenaria]|uniref:uncharacterized protein LOC123548655 isoform X2 n=1 Tax=Mercenaria mercenaria TaxID=6596 RepID=UPI00234F4880|nr:uncharacterized protein LOC123548655 isoform X2 [Mercenaria mercenaria]
MRAVAFLLLCVCYKVEAQGGGIKMKIGEHGLNEVISYLLDHVLIPYVQNDLDVEDYVFEMGKTARILVDRLQLNTLEGQYGSVNILDGNKVDVTVGFATLGLNANLTRVAGDDIIYAPQTIVYFKDCQLQITFSLGTEQNKDAVTFDTCKATIGDFKAEGKLGSALEGAYVLGGSESISSLVVEICPTLENITNDNLNDILSVQETVSISSSTYGKMSVNMKLLSASTGTDFITMEVEVTVDTERFVGDIHFPVYGEKQSTLDAVLLINDQLLSKVCEHTIQDHIFKNFVFNKTVNEVWYTVEVNEASIQSRVVSTDEGTSVIWNVTIAVYTSDNCMVYQLKMDSVIPVVFGFNGTLIDIHADKDRFRREYMVSNWNKACTGSAGKLDTSKKVQKDLLQELNSEFEKRLKDKSIDFKLPKGKWYGFKDPRIRSLKGGMVFSSSLRVGDNNQVTVEKLTHVYNTHYDSKFTSYTYSDGEQVDVRGPPVSSPKPPVSSSVLQTYSLTLTVLIILLIIIH